MHYYYSLLSTSISVDIDVKSNENVYGTFGISSKGEGTSEVCKIQHPEVVWPSGENN